jgi:syntaxin 5
MCDRTKEFLNIVAIKGQSQQLKKEKTAPSQPKTRSAFYEATAEIGAGIQTSSMMLSQLTKLVRRQGLFDDSSQDIDAMVFNIKQALTELNAKCDNAQTYVDNKKSSYGKQNQSANHNGTVVNQLKSDLMIATQDFKSVLEMRSSKMKEQTKRKVELTGNGILSPAKQLHASQAKQRKTGGQKIGTNMPNPYLDLMKKSAANPYASSSSSSSSDVDLEEQTALITQQLLVAPPSVETQYYDSRERAVTEVEKTIVELGTIFQRLSTMISEQQQLVERIDEDVENAVSNTNSARDYMLDMYKSVSSNRGMYMKLSGILVIFIIFFTLFLM